MSGSERVLQALRAELQLELTSLAVEVAQASSETTNAELRVAESRRRCDVSVAELRATLGALRIDPALLQAMSHIRRSERVRLQEDRARLAAAEGREQQARRALTELRNREHSLDRALQAERNAHRIAEQARDQTVADDLWLQHVSRTPR